MRREKALVLDETDLWTIICQWAEQNAFKIEGRLPSTYDIHSAHYDPIRRKLYVMVGHADFPKVKPGEQVHCTYLEFLGGAS